MAFFLLTIAFICFASIHSATLDAYCNNQTACVGKGLVCIDNACRCDVPWFEPCNSLCEVNPQVAYQGEVCRTEENCVPNTICRNETCQCLSDYEAKNGLCFKPLNITCQNDTDCWSNFCSQGQCQCPFNTKPVNGSTCERRLVNLHNTWEEANATNEFCPDPSFCAEGLAVCEADLSHPQDKFCRCPTNYRIQENKCVPIQGQYLSPLDAKPADYGQCGACEDSNAVCLDAAGQRTCWCRSGYKREGNKCVTNRPGQGIIFPNRDDVQKHIFTNSCSAEVANSLCVCSPGDEFVGRNQPCRKYERQWIDAVYEYGLCTQITSLDKAIAQQRLCPAPLTCAVKDDKHVCTCGIDRFRDLINASRCVYHTGKGANDPAAECPTNARKSAPNAPCECLPGYQGTVDGRRCEIRLVSGEFPSADCPSSSQSNNSVCQGLYGGKAVLCKTGECRCQTSDSAADDRLAYCYSKVNISLVAPAANCTPNASLSNNHCICNAGFLPSSDLRTCVRMNLTLVSNQGDASSVGSPYSTADCRALFTGPLEFYTNTDCRCLNSSFLDTNQTRCWYKLNIPLANVNDDTDCPPNSILTSDRKCQCGNGYQQTTETTCVPILARIYDDGDPNAPNITGLTNGGCITAFGYASEKSAKGSYCICKNPNAYAKSDYTTCYFLIGASITGLADRSSCPPDSAVSPSTPPYACVCDSGYGASINRRTCERLPLQLSGSNQRPASNQANCSQISTADCQSLFGVDAFCQANQCYCDRQFSFQNEQGRCEKISGFVFPGVQELDRYSCQTADDCGKAKGVVCDYWYGNKAFKVCQCEAGVYLDPSTQTCVDNRCSNCNLSANFECRNYVCQCKPGYYQDGARCVEQTTQLELHQFCNTSGNVTTRENGTLICNTRCQRAVCPPQSTIKNSRCVPYQLADSTCFYNPQVCQYIDANAGCSRDENKCVCQSDYRLFDRRCATPIGFVCARDSDCDFGMRCKGQQCDCREDQNRVNDVDSSGYRLERCLNKDDSHNSSTSRPGNGVSHLHYQSIVLLLLPLIHLFFF